MMPTQTHRGAFKTRAAKVEKFVLAARSDVQVEINPDKPRKGCFEVRVGDTKVISLTDMPRPFKKLKDLDMEEVAQQVVAAL